ncbi:MAG: hypothetical protein AMXMBFR47_13140 [Planctomycetota bacterium]
MVLLILAIAIIVVVGVVAAKAPGPIRVVVAIGAIVVVAILSFNQGVAYKSVLFYSSYVYWIREYSTHLTHLADQDDCEQLRRTVRRFDERMKDEPDNAANLEDTMHELLKVGRYYEDKNTSKPSPSIP